jgi:hypothetical protein
MAIFAVIDIETNTLINRVIADSESEPPIGTKFVEELEGYYWDGEKMSPMPLPTNEEE